MGSSSAVVAGAGAASCEDDEEEEEKVLSLGGALCWLALITLLISFLSDFLMEGIQEASSQLKVPLPFLTTIVVPIVGNAAEHASAVIFAMKDKMDISLGVAMGGWLGWGCSIK
jgi:Ca2+:H+ antiporter